MIRSREQAAVLAALAEQIARSSSHQSTAAAVTQRALETVPEADSVSITLRTTRRAYVTLASSDDLARDADELQYALREGPCIATADGRDLYRSGDVAHDERWPRWGPKAGALGVGSLLSVRLLSSGSPTGALNFYARRTGRFGDQDEVDFATLYATHVAIALSSSQRVTGLETALHSRHVIGFAQGILSERYGLDMDRSFDLLRRCSNLTNTRISVLAEEIVRTRQLPELPSTDEPDD